MAYRLVRSLVYKRGVGIRETVWVGVWFGKTNSVGVDLFLHAEPRRRSELLHGVLDGGVGGRHGSNMGRLRPVWRPSLLGHVITSRASRWGG